MEAFEIFSQEGDLESCGDLSWEDLLGKHKVLSDCEADSCAHVRVVLDVTDVLVSLHLWWLSFVRFFRVALIGNMLYRNRFLSSKSVHVVVEVRKR